MRSNLKKIRRHFIKHQIRTGRFLASHGLPEYTILSLFSILMGATAGLVAVGFHEIIDVLRHTFFATERDRSFDLGYAVVAIPVVGMFVQWLMTRIAPKEAEQKGVLEVIKAVALRNGHIPFRTTLFHFLAPALCMGTGGTVGPEAPAAQSGAGAVSSLGRLMGLSESRQRIFTAAGAGAAIAAVFNTPLGGVFFAIEVVLLNDFRVMALSAFLLASVTASAVSRIILGNDPAFVFNPVILGSYRFYFLYLFMGFGAGLLSMSFIRLNEWIRQKIQKLYRIVPSVIGMVAVGLFMGVAGLLEPHIWGVGYSTINNILAQALSPSNVLLLLLLKMILVVIILSAGGFGGVFAPSLFMGACFGYLFVFIINNVFSLSLDYTTYTLVGMGAVLAGVNSVPLTAIMILFEMTNDYHFILPLMLGVVGSTIVAQITIKGSIHARELQRRGFRYAMGRETRILRSILVKDVMRKDILTVPEGLALAKLVQTCLERPHHSIYTVDYKGTITGVITSSQLQQIITEFEVLQTVVLAKDLADPNVTLIDQSENLEYALRLFAKRRVEEFPVVKNGSDGHVLGVLSHQEVLNAYNETIVKLNLAEGLAGDIKAIELNEVRQVLPGFSMAEVHVPPSFIGKTINGLNLRNRYGVDILMIEKTEGPFADDQQEKQRMMPDRNYRFTSGDLLMVFGQTDKVNAFKILTHYNIRN